MHPDFQRLFDEIESQRNKILHSVGHLTTEQLNQSLAQGKWSAAQVLSHIIAAERMSLQYIQKKIQGIDQIKDTGAWEEMKMIFLKISQRVPGLKFKAPKRVVESTQHYSDMETLRREWTQVRNELKSLLESIPHQLANRRIYRHARAGYLNSKHALIFFREHIIHHRPQLEKLIRELKN